jgi:nicotinate-nucleotide adenylyltransferase
VPETLARQACVVLGGSFNPVHFGHLRIAEELADALEVESVALLPNGIPPHRDRARISTSQRIDMLRLAIADNPRLRLDLRETRRDGASYMVDTLSELRTEHGADCPLVLALGTDAFAGLASWREPERILALANLIVLTRPDCEVKAPDLPFNEARELADLLGKPAGLVGRLDVTQLDISSSAIRSAQQAGGSMRYLLPRTVREYIELHNLYRETEA